MRWQYVCERPMHGHELLQWRRVLVLRNEADCDTHKDTDEGDCVADCVAECVADCAAHDRAHGHTDRCAELRAVDGAIGRADDGANGGEGSRHAHADSRSERYAVCYSNDGANDVSN